MCRWRDWGTCFKCFLLVFIIFVGVVVFFGVGLGGIMEVFLYFGGFLCGSDCGGTLFGR